MSGNSASWPSCLSSGSTLKCPATDFSEPLSRSAEAVVITVSIQIASPAATVVYEDAYGMEPEGIKTVDVSGLPAGLYAVKAVTGGQRFTKKLP